MGESTMPISMLSSAKGWSVLMGGGNRGSSQRGTGGASNDASTSGFVRLNDRRDKPLHPFFFGFCPTVEGSRKYAVGAPRKDSLRDGETHAWKFGGERETASDKRPSGC